MRAPADALWTAGALNLSLRSWGRRGHDVCSAPEQMLHTDYFTMWPPLDPRVTSGHAFCTYPFPPLMPLGIDAQEGQSARRAHLMLPLLPPLR